MKRFHELTKEQQDLAVSYAMGQMAESVENGLIRFDKPVSGDLLREYATYAAEEAWYAQVGEIVVYEIAE